MTTLYSILLSARENYVQQKSIQEKILYEHGMYMKQLLIEGKLILAGPFMNYDGGQVILRVNGEEEVIEIMRKRSGSYQ